jgi:hypothetical protein
MEEGKIIPYDKFKRRVQLCSPVLCVNKGRLNWEYVYNLIVQLDGIDENKKNLLLVRLKYIYTYIDNQFLNTKFYYDKAKLFVIIAGIINPSLLSINSNSENSHYTLLFWTIWVMQLSVTMMTAVMNFFKWDKKYFLFLAARNKVETEIWTYLELTGKYSMIDPLNDEEVKTLSTSHLSKYKRVMFNIESIFKRLRDSDLELENEDETMDHSKNQATIDREKRSKYLEQKIQHIESQGDNIDPEKLQQMKEEADKYRKMLDKIKNAAILENSDVKPNLKTKNPESSTEEEKEERPHLQISMPKNREQKETL